MSMFTSTLTYLVSEGRPFVSWFFPTGSVPNDDALVVRQASYGQFVF